MSTSIIAIDIGNTNVTIGFGDRASESWSRIVRFHPDADRTEDEWVSLLFPHLPLVEDDPARVMCCSVVPAVTPRLLDAVSALIESEPVIVTSTSAFSITIGTDNPAQTGADRLVNANTAFSMFGRPVIVVDTGTATKIDAVDADGVLLGGVIAPGLGLGLDALAQRAAQLSTVPLAAPPLAIGSSTIAAVQSGVVLGHAAMIEGMVGRVQSELGASQAIVLTGGYCALLEALLPTVTHVLPELTLDGLRMLAD